MTAHPVVRFLLWVGLAYLGLMGAVLVFGSVSVGMFAFGGVLLVGVTVGAVVLRRHRPDTAPKI